MLETLWATLEEPALLAKIKERPSLFLGTRGPEGLQSMVMTGIGSVLQAARLLKKAQLQVLLQDKEIVFWLTVAPEDDFGYWGREHNKLAFVNLAVIKSLATAFKIEIQQDHRLVVREYSGSQLLTATEEETAADTKWLRVTFTPDYRFFGLRTLPYFLYYDYCQQLAILNSGLTIHLQETAGQQNVFSYNSGLLTYLQKYDDYLARRGKPAHFKGRTDHLEIEAVISRNDQGRVVAGFANNEPTFLGGTHLEGCLDGAIQAFNQFLEEQNNLAYYDTAMFCDRFDLVLSIKLANPKYFGNTRQKLRNPEAYDEVKAFIQQEFLAHLRSYPMWYRG